MHKGGACWGGADGKRLEVERMGMERMSEERLPGSPLKTSVVLRIEPRVPVLGIWS